MRTEELRNTQSDRKKRWLRFVCGLCGLIALAAFFASGYTPPGMCGEVIRHNQTADIDASPFFYGDVNNILDLIEAAEQMKDTEITGNH